MSESSESGEGDDVGIMSDSSEDSGSNTETSKPPEDDLFSDIFQATIINTALPTKDETVKTIWNFLNSYVKWSVLSCF